MPVRGACIDTFVAPRVPYTPHFAAKAFAFSRIECSSWIVGMLVAVRAILLSVIVLAIGGCRVVEPHAASKSPLIPLAVASDAISLEVFTAPIPQGDAQLAELWKLVDEQPLPADVRRRLGDNGFRAGLVGPNMPAALSDILKVTEQRTAEEDKHAVSLNPDGAVNLRVLHVKAGKRTELTLGSMHESLALLESIDAQIGGKTYRKAECRFGLRAYHESDGRLRLELTPELHHGEFQNRTRGSDGAWMFTQERPKRVFHELQMEPKLAPGQMLLVASLPGRTGSAGYHFFTDTSGDKPVPRLWVIRAARAAADTAFYEQPVDDDLSAVSDDIEE